MPLLICIFLTACGNDSSVGIIEGADGPSAILVSEKGEKAMYEQITKEFGGIIDWPYEVEK